MTKQSEWLALSDRCEKATGQSYELDLALATALYELGGSTVNYDPATWLERNCTITGSLDAIVSVIEQELPGWAWKVGTCSVSDDAWLVPDLNCPTHGARLREQFGDAPQGSIWDEGIDIDRRPPGHVALAMCQAFCEAMAAIASKEAGI